MPDRETITRTLSERALARLRRECTLVASEVWADDDHRVDFIGYKPAVSTAHPAGLEHGIFTFVEVKSCMNDFKSGHGLTFEGDTNWLVCPADLYEQLREQRQIPYRTAVLCPNARGALVEKIHAASYGSNRHASTLELLWRMVTHSASSSRATREVAINDAYCPWCNPYNKKPLSTLDSVSGDVSLLDDLSICVDLAAKTPQLQLFRDNGIDEAGIPISYCPVCGRPLKGVSHDA